MKAWRTEMKRVLVVFTLLALSCVASAAGAAANAPSALGLGFALSGAGGRLGIRRTSACSPIGARVSLLGPAQARRGVATLPCVVPGRAGRAVGGTLRLLAVDADVNDEDEWDSWAMLKDTGDADENDAVADVVLQAEASGNKPVLEDDPRATHVPAEVATAEDDLSFWMNSVFGQVRQAK